MDENSLNTQTQYWDNESTSAGYFERQISGLQRIGVCDMLDAALKKLPSSPKKILEIGGGSQFVARYLASKFPNAEIICTDISMVRMQAADDFHKTKPSNLTTVGGIDATELPYQDGEFDLIIGDAVLHHIDHLKLALFEINRCLSRGGVAIFVREPVIGALGVLTYKMLQKTNRGDEHIVKNYFEYKRMLSQWEYEFIMAGFSVKIVNHWRRQELIWRLRCLFPNLTPCYIGFYLTAKTKAHALVEKNMHKD